jgi:hypothetical protein
MQIRTRIAAVLVMTLAAAAGPAVAQDVTLTPQLRAGDAFQLEVVRTRESSERPQQNNRSRSLVDVRVVSAGPEGFALDWVPGDTVLDNPRAAQDPLVAAALQAIRGMTFRLNLNADGELTGLANQADVVPKLKAMGDGIVQELAARLPEAQRKPLLDFMGKVLSPELLIASATRDAGTYFGLNGVALLVGEAVEVELEQPNPFGGSSIPAKFKVSIESATAGFASLKTTTTYDPAALVGLTEALARQAGAPIPPEELAKLPPIEMADEGTYLFDREFGLMKEVIVSRRVAAGPTRRLDGWQIRLLKGPR